LGKLLANFRSSIIGALPKIRDEDYFPFEAKQRHYLVKVLNEWNDFFLRTITKYRDGKLDWFFNHSFDAIIAESLSRSIVSSAVGQRIG
jgi:hypothetical protein